MTTEEILKVCPELGKIRFEDINKIMLEKNPKFVFNPQKTWKEMGLDDLDAVELIMELEKRFDFVFLDSLYDWTFCQNCYPINFVELLRETKLKNLGI